MHVRTEGSLDTVVVELVTLVAVTDDVVGLSTVVAAVVVVDSDDPIEDVRDVELVKVPADVDAEDVVINIDDVDDVSVLVEDVMVADVDVTPVDTTSVGVVDVELVGVGESSEVLEKEVTGDAESVVVGVVRVVGVLEDSVDELEGAIVCDSRAVGAADVDVDSAADSEIKADVKEELITVELFICRTVIADAVYPLEIKPTMANRMIPPNTHRTFIDTNSKLQSMHQCWSCISDALNYGA